LVSGTLHVVATPLGNLGDLSDRAKAVLRSVAVVAAEDTRRAAILLQHVDAHPKTLSFHAHSPTGRLYEILDVLETGSDVALLTDAGTPAVSDPGAVLVRFAREAGVPVVAVPGPSAVATALSIAGLPADRYVFLGFPPRKGSDRAQLLDEAARSKWTVVMFESPERLVRLLEDLAGVAGGKREAAVAREMTKVHEECKTGTLNELAGYYREHPPRGEVTVLLAGASGEVEDVNWVEVEARARALLHEGLSRRDAAARLAEEFGVPKREAYAMVNEL
jgi:16S rRNA (cytidine1402-2'-O)-methyltransferase